MEVDLTGPRRRRLFCFDYTASCPSDATQSDQKRAGPARDSIAEVAFGPEARPMLAPNSTQAKPGLE